MNSICLFGGGRWSRVLLTVLLQAYPELKITWVSKNSYGENVEWLKKYKTRNVLITSDEEQAWRLKPQAIIVATASHLHMSYIKQALINRIPVLCEKPFCFTTHEAQELIYLGENAKVAIGVNFEFMHASYLFDFANYLKNIRISSIDLIWEDVFCEMRYGEKKFGDFYTPLMYDSFQHCWSLLKFLFPQDPLSISSVSYEETNSRAIVKANMGNKLTNIVLSRRAAQRVRKISINKGAIILDFAIEPGASVINQRTIYNEWKGNRPLLAALDSFFKVIKYPALLYEWQLNIFNCMDVISLSEKATELLEQAQKKCLQKKYPLSVEDIITRNILIDLFLPKLASLGDYHRAHDLEEQINFASYLIKRPPLMEAINEAC
ncbi:Gfo/Idh/MocA family oxidoreductase [Legionella tucsonensis]|uniref:Oxidoreductase n=1 Tax=Legionella tucsonensis TaxID=40335 RepID=A0A0W0ZSS5_9GAMM|nr:Gfo/Idh/MocA family oxidoreductase [Legionella tucsonensis]KTD72255.1 oxidoreductase [Legionella tucsonensis]